MHARHYSFCSNMATTTAEEKKKAAHLRMGVGTNSVELPAVLIEHGVQKYVLIEVTGTEAPIYLVRGKCSAAYHKDAARSTLDQLRVAGAGYHVLGGGRIRADLPKGHIEIYGFSYGFPWRSGAQHNVAAALIGQAFPAAYVTTSDEGY
jgi:hypothetical protein